MSYRYFIFSKGCKEITTQYMSETSFRIGTRNSPLALCQAEALKKALEESDSDLNITLVPIHSQADWKKSEGEKPLSEENGGKGLFAKEIELALIDGAIDCGVHSLKDMASFLPQGLVIEHVLPRANPLDAFICKEYGSIAELPEGAVIGSCSARRSAIIQSIRPDVKVVPFRGNVQTRIDKIEAGQVDATFLAMAGIERLGISDPMIHSLSAEEMLPACGQGAICIEVREEDIQTQKILDKVHCTQTGFCVFAEREVLRALDGSCHTPIGVFGEMHGERLNLRAEVYALDGSEVFRKSMSGVCHSIQEATDLGKQMGYALNNIVPPEMLK